MVPDLSPEPCCSMGLLLNSQLYISAGFLGSRFVFLMAAATTTGLTTPGWHPELRGDRELTKVAATFKRAKGVYCHSACQARSKPRHHLLGHSPPAPILPQGVELQFQLCLPIPSALK